MNGYLFYIGSNMAEVRRVMNLTQEELSGLMGVSRPTVIKLEQDPSKMTKALGFALFGAVVIEMQARKRRVEKISPYEYRSAERIGSFVEDVREASGISISGLGKIATVGLGKLVPGIGSLLSEGLKKGWKPLKDYALVNLKENVHWDEEKAAQIIIAVKKMLTAGEKRLLECFKLEALTLEQFGEELEKGTEEDYDLW